MAAEDEACAVRTFSVKISEDKGGSDATLRFRLYRLEEVRKSESNYLKKISYCQSLCMWVRWRSLLLNATWHELHVYGWDLDVFVVKAGCKVGGTGLRGAVMVVMLG